MQDSTWELIKNYDCTTIEKAEDLAHLIMDLWNTNYGKATYEDGVLHLVTGGWSENEEIITALHQNKMFFAGYWAAEIRGGAYWFQIKCDWSRNIKVIFEKIKEEDDDKMQGVPSPSS